MKLYGFPPTRSIRVLWTLRELDVEFEFVNVDPTKGELRRPEFLAVNPAGKLPVLVDGDFILTESVAIVLYLAEKYPEKGLLPSGLRARAEVNRWLLFSATELEQPLWRIARHTSVYPPEKRLAADSGIHARHGGGPGEVHAARQAASSARVHGADVQAPERPTADCGGVREPTSMTTRVGNAPHRSTISNLRASCARWDGSLPTSEPARAFVKRVVGLPLNNLPLSVTGAS